jgi:hypothetical protein
MYAKTVAASYVRSNLTVLPPLEKKKSSAHDILNVTGFSAFLDRCHDLEQFCHLIFFVNPKLTDMWHFSVCEPPGLKPGHLTVCHHVELVPDST